MRASGQKEYISLARGLITEASDLNFPEGATSSELNFTVDRKGMIRRRRKGFQDLLETPFVIPNPSVEIENVFYWRTPSLVCVILTDDTPRTLLRFHAVDDNFTYLTQVVISDTATRTQVAQTTNYLTIALCCGRKPILCEYDSVGDTITVSSINIHIRDFELVDDGLSVAERPATLSDNHTYNLYNAGWYLERRDQYTASQPFGNPITIFFNDTEGQPTGVYPSNADIVTLGLSINENGVTTLRPDEIKNNNVGNSEAPRGHYVYDINDFNRTAKLTTPEDDGLPNTTLSLLGTVDTSGVVTYQPDNPNPPSGTPEGGGGVNPDDPEFDIGDPPPDFEIK